MKLTSTQFTLFVATLCVVAGGSYRLGQRSVPLTVVLSPAVQALLPSSSTSLPSEATLVDGFLTRRLEDLYAGWPRIFSMDRSGDPMELSSPGFPIRPVIRTCVLLGEVELPRITRVRVLENYGDVSLVQVIDPGVDFHGFGYVRTSNLRGKDGARPFGSRLHAP